MERTRKEKDMTALDMVEDKVYCKMCGRAKPEANTSGESRVDTPRLSWTMLGEEEGKGEEREWDQDLGGQRYKRGG